MAAARCFLGNDDVDEKVSQQSVLVNLQFDTTANLTRSTDRHDSSSTWHDSQSRGRD